MQTTPWAVSVNDNGVKIRLRATFGMKQVNEKESYFSIVSELQVLVRGLWQTNLCNMYQALQRLFPDLANACRWRRFVHGYGPLHYLANGLEFHEQIAGRSHSHPDLDPVTAFKNAVVFGAVAGDLMPEADASADVVDMWLRLRLPSLQAAFARDMADIGVAVK